MKNLKEDLVFACQEKLKNQLNFLQEQLLELKNANSGETKSTAGDKHETGRAMIHLEQEKLYSQLGVAQKQDSFFNSIDFKPKSSISIGSLVKTNSGFYLIAASLGIIQAQGQTVFVVSAVAPIGQLLLNKTIGDEVLFNGKTIKILEIL